MYKDFFKDLLDFYFALILLIVFSPLMIIVYLILYLSIGSPMYYQKRPGYLNKPFLIYKFKTLIDKNCKNYHPKKKNLQIWKFFKKNWY